MNRFAMLLLLGAALSGAGSSAQQPAPAEHGVQLSTIDPSAKPCGDFFQYANGGWLKANQIPSEYASWDVYTEIYERNLALLKTILDEAARDATAPAGSVRRLVGDFFATGMDERAVEQEGLGTLASRFERIRRMKTPDDLAGEIGGLHTEGIDAGFAFYVSIDDKASANTIGKLAQAGLGLPDRDYYTKQDRASKSLREKYAGHLCRMFQLLGDPPAEARKHARTVMAMETRMAEASMTGVEKRDPNATYNKMTLEQIASEAPGFDWPAYFKVIGLPGSKKALVVQQPAFIREFALMAKSLPMDNWRVYLRWRLIHETAPYLSSVFVNENFNFFSTVLSGVPEQRPRWKRVMSATEQAMGEAVGQLYVEKAFSPDAKRKALNLVKNLQAILRERIINLGWMSGPTKQKALGKLDALTIKIGYPDKWRDYSRMEIARRSYVGNALAANLFEFHRNLAKLGKPVDRSEWLMNPQEVNAYYEPLVNEVCFPAGILQPPFFDAEADDASNYGATGSTIGHEMTHGFDDQGSQYDATGNLVDWWTPEDRKAYAERQAVMVKQYDAYKPLADMAINGKLTLGENIADFGGLLIAFKTFEKTMEGKPRLVDAGGFTPEQRFFLAYAQSFREIVRPEALRVQLNTDPHSPGKFRVIGPLADLPEFYDAFKCTEGGLMHRSEADRPTIW